MTDRNFIVAKNPAPDAASGGMSQMRTMTIGGNAPAPTHIADDQIEAALDAMWPSDERIYDDKHDSAEAGMRAAINAILSFTQPPQVPAEDYQQLLHYVNNVLTDNQLDWKQPDGSTIRNWLKARMSGK